jgi:hypothetical protein
MVEGDKLKEFSFDDEQKTEGTVPMGTVVSDDAVLKETVEKAMTEEKVERDFDNFMTFSEGLPSIVFDKRDIAHFVDMVGYHSRLGYDNYTLSFKLDTEGYDKTGTVKLVYNNGTVLCISEVKVKMSGVVSNFIISVETMLKVFSASHGYMFLFEENSNIYGYVLGGRVYLETYKVTVDICAKEYLMEQMSTSVIEETSTDQKFISTLKMLYEVVKSGSRIEEKAIYFEKDATYIYAGIVMGMFEGLGLKLTLQDIDINTLSKYFFDTEGIIKINDHGIFLKFTSNGREVYLQKRGLTLSDDMKYTDFSGKGSIQVPISSVNSIVSFLIGMSNNTGIASLESENDNLKITCYQKSLCDKSLFSIKGPSVGDGLSEIKVPLSTLKTFTKVFNSQVTFRNNGSKLYLSGIEGKLVIFGNQ